MGLQNVDEIDDRSQWKLPIRRTGRHLLIFAVVDVQSKLFLYASLYGINSYFLTL